MALLVSAKGNDVLAWRAAGDFTATFRQQLLARLEFCKSGEGEQLLASAGQALDELVAENDSFILRCKTILDEVSVCTDHSRFKEFTDAYFTTLYEHVGIHHSATAFYELSDRFLRVLSGTIMRQARVTLGKAAENLPQLKLIALGPAGRQEFSPFCPFHTMLIHGDVDSVDRGAVNRLGQLIHEGFAACGFLIDEKVSPFNEAWCGSPADWRKRLLQWLDQGEFDDLIDFFRLSDQSLLYQDEGFDDDFFQLFVSHLKKYRAAMDFLVTRVQGLSHGIGILGGMRFEKKGPYRGRFALLDNGLHPLSAAISALALIKNLSAASTPQRIREVLWKRKLNVDMAERLLHAWHALHELRLLREAGKHPVWSDEGALHLEIDDLSDSEQATLRESLETVGVIQRHVGLTYNSMEG